MTPYFCATCEMALATPELIAPTKKPDLLLLDQALGDARAGGGRGLGVEMHRT